MSVANVVQAVKLFEEKYNIDMGKNWFDMEHDILFVPGPPVEDVSIEDVELLDNLGVIYAEEFDSWQAFG